MKLGEGTSQSGGTRHIPDIVRIYDRAYWPSPFGGFELLGDLRKDSAALGGLHFPDSLGHTG